MASMVLVGIALSTAMASPVIAGSKEWTIDPPAGWQDDAALTNNLRDQLAEKARFENTETRVWASATHDGILILQWHVVSIDGDIRQQIDRLDRAMVKGITQASTAQDRSSRTVGSMVIRDTTIDQFRGKAVRARVVRRYQPAEDGLHALIAICTAASDPVPCDAAIDGLQFSVPDPISLDDSRNEVAYQLGRVIGVMLFVGLPLWVVFGIRKRLRARAAVKAAARPGSRSAPDAAGDDR